MECQDLILEMVETNDMQPNAGLEADKHERLNVILDQLSPRDEYVLRFKYWIGDKNPIRTDEELATMFQISATSIVPIEERSLKQLKHYPEIIGWFYNVYTNEA
ncbi:hypothetical protein [Weissella ceti]|nr:hypothetical protein [Weissella ceti]